MPNKLYNLAGVATATTGTGTVTLGSALPGLLTFANAGAQDGDVVSYSILDGDNTEVGTGTYTLAGTTLTRTTVANSTNSGNKINLSGDAKVYITIMASDMPTGNNTGDQVGDGVTITGAGSVGDPYSVTPTIKVYMNTNFS